MCWPINSGKDLCINCLSFCPSGRTCNHSSTMGKIDKIFCCGPANLNDNNSCGCPPITCNTMDGFVCINGTCTCDPNNMTNNRNCGCTGRACNVDGGYRCTGGTCICDPSNLSNTRNCACNGPCPAKEFCEAGRCKK